MCGHTKSHQNKYAACLADGGCFAFFFFFLLFFFLFYLIHTMHAYLGGKASSNANQAPHIGCLDMANRPATVNQPTVLVGRLTAAAATVIRSKPGIMIMKCVCICAGGVRSCWFGARMVYSSNAHASIVWDNRMELSCDHRLMIC